jgi:hypothetical protein
MRTRRNCLVNAGDKKFGNENIYRFAVIPNYLRAEIFSALGLARAGLLSGVEKIWL